MLSSHHDIAHVCSVVTATQNAHNPFMLKVMIGSLNNLTFAINWLPICKNGDLSTLIYHVSATNSMGKTTSNTEPLQPTIHAPMVKTWAETTKETTSTASANQNYRCNGR